MRAVSSVGLIIAAFCMPICAQTVRPSGELSLNVFSDYASRQVCVTRFPDLRSKIDRVYFSSPLRKIVVPCDGLQCLDPKLTADMKRVTEDSSFVSNVELRRICESEYQRTVRNTERQFATELSQLPYETPMLP